MGIRIYALDETAPVPRAVVAEIECDSDHGLFPVRVAIEGAHWWPDVHAALMADGWSYRPGADRVFLCQSCSGKRVNDPTVC